MPPLARWAVPLLLLANDALLLYSNFGHGATVHVRIFDGATGGGQTRSVESASLYTITLGRSIRDMWNAKAYFTSVLIAGAWRMGFEILYGGLSKVPAPQGGFITRILGLTHPPTRFYTRSLRRRLAARQVLGIPPLLVPRRPLPGA